MTMRNLRSASVATLTVLGISFVSLLTVLSGTASADTGACASYLEDHGEDTTVRYQYCAETETLGDTATPEYAMASCVPLMTTSGLREDLSHEACALAIAP